MRDIFRNLQTHNYDISISVSEWKGILCLPEIREKPNILWALEKWYLAPNYTASCKSLGEKYQCSWNVFSVQNRILGEIAVKHLQKFRLVNEDGNETYWGIAWIELKQEQGAYIVRLRPELVNAIRELGLFAQDTEYSINRSLQEQNLRQEKHFEFRHERHEKRFLSDRSVSLYPRDSVIAKNALCHAEHRCEIDTSHCTFPRMIDGLPYMETHHLVPLKYTDYFDVSLDVPENIICLCSNCHNRIHYGKNKDEMIKFLWYLRNNDLHEVGIDIKLTELLTYYKKI
ncbi:MAG: HNH endonuclease [Acetanaerobacterium sp.]